MNSDMMEALYTLEREKGISVEVMLEALANALVTAYKRMPDAAEEALVEIDIETGEIHVIAQELDEDGHASRLRGVLAAAGTDAITITTDSGDHTVALDAVDAARTVFEWGPAPKPGKGSRPGRKKEVANS